MNPLHRLAEQTATAEVLDKPAAVLETGVRALVDHGPVKDVLNGTWLGHPAHPMMIAMPIGAWACAGLLDLLGGQDGQRSADRLVGAGILTAIPTAATGAAQWLDVTTPAKRMGTAHALANSVALGLFGASWLARRAGLRALGKALSFAGLAAVGVGGYLGGHLTYALGVGVDHTAWPMGPEGWHRTGLLEQDLRPGQVTTVEVEGRRVLVTRNDGVIVAYDDRCTHLGGPLSEGHVADGCVTCPWHASRFSLASGSVEASPATMPLAAFDVRVVEGVLELRQRLAAEV